MKMYIHTDELVRIKALIDSLGFEGTFELEADSSSGIGTTMTAHVPQSIQSLNGVFSYVISDVENW